VDYEAAAKGMLRGEDILDCDDFVKCHIQHRWKFLQNVELEKCKKLGEVNLSEPCRF
jgi:hypothetical protein